MFSLLCSCQENDEDQPIIYPTKPIVSSAPLDSVKVLLIGNSFSADAVEQNLYELSKLAGKKIVIGNLYYGGASLELHWNNYQKREIAYSYFKCNKEGKITNVLSSINDAINDEKWDYISLQQVSNYSGVKESFSPYLDNLIVSIKRENRFSNTKYILHQTWAYQNGSSHPGFVNYNRDQLTMYNSIVNTYDYWNSKNYHISYIVPSGTAIQNGRSTYIGDNFNRDGYHLNDRGRFLAACTWFEKLFNVDVRKNKYKPKNINEGEIAILKSAAHSAIINPNSITTEINP